MALFLRALHDMNIHRRDIHADEGTGLHILGGVDLPFISHGVYHDLVVDALEDDGFHNAGNFALIGGTDLEVLRTDNDLYPLLGLEALIDAVEIVIRKFHEEVLMHDAIDDIAFTDEIGHEGIAGLIVDILRGTDLKDVAIPHDDDAVGHGERFFLIVGDIDEGDLQCLLDAL